MKLRVRVVDAVFDGLELLASGYDLVRGLQRTLVKEEEPFPLTHRDVEHQQAQIRSATAHRK
jgi:hypothetical protein